MKKGHKIALLVLAILSLTVLGRDVFAAARVGYYTITLPGFTGVTMGDASVTLPVTINNLATSTATVGYIRIDFNSAIYYVSQENAAPPNWTVVEIKNAGAGQTYIKYKTATNPIPIGGSQVFNVILTGTGNGNIPAAVADQTDAIDDDNNSTDLLVSDTNSNYFDRNATGNADSWTRKSLYATMSASPGAVGTGDSVSVMMTVTNRSSAAQTNVQPSAMNFNTTETGGATLTAGPTPAVVASLAAGAAATFQWTYTATGSGSIQFCNSARNGTNSSTSKNVCSYDVAIGDFTATLSISPPQIVSGQEVTVTMTASNKGTSARNNVAPSALTFEVLGGNAASVCSGPTPANVGSLASGSSAMFQWTCTVTSTQIGSSFRYNAFATSNSGNSLPSPAYSNIGVISAYSVTVTPATVPSGSGATFAFRITNNGGYPLFKVRIDTPAVGFSYSSASGGCTGNWTPVTVGTPVQITFSTTDVSTCTCAAALNCIPCAGGECNFYVTYSAVPAVAVNTDYVFTVKVWDTQLTQPNAEPRASLNANVTVTSHAVTLEAIPETAAPGCTALLIATITPAVASGGVVDFFATAGSLLNVSPTTSSSDASADIRAPIPSDPAITGANVWAVYQGALSNVVPITFPTNAPSCPKRVRWKEQIQ